MANNFNSNGGNFIDRDFVNKLKSPNVHEKENEYTGKMVMPIMTFKFIMGILSVLSGVFFYLLHIRNFMSLGDKIPIYAYFVIPGLFILSLIFLHGAPVDIWVPHIANSRIGSSYCKIGLTGLTIDYDVIYSKKDINKFIEEITEKSEDWNYFIKKISSRTMTIKIKVRPKVKIPSKVNFEEDYASNEQWNYIPLGICLTDNSVLGTVNWMLNDNNKVKGEHKATIPSTSFLIAGGTGSGKSVLENNIIRHCNKFSDNFQAMLVDVKRVEFGGLSNIKGVKAVALDIKEAEACLKASREIMYSRFEFMEKSGVNNVYKLNNYKCSYFVIENVFSGVRKLYQFDEIFYTEINGNVEITTIDNIYNKAKSEECKIYFSGQKEKPLKINTSKDACKNDKSGETLFIMEITPGDFFSYNNKIFEKKNIIQTNEGEFSAEQIFDMVSKGKTMSGNEGKIDKDTFKCIECTFKPKAILTVVDEMSEVMGTDNYKAQASISDSISSIARLGRAAACHLCLATQRPSGNVISSDLKNNIHMTTLLGGFGSSESVLCFDEDISDFCKPDIKGRGFVKTGNDIYEYQSFWIGEPKYNLKDKDFEGLEPINNSKSSNENLESSEYSNNIEEVINNNENEFKSDETNEEYDPIEEARAKRLAKRKKKQAEEEKKKEEEFESMIESENSDENFKEFKRPKKEIWDAEDFFSEDSSEEDSNDSKESKSFEERKSSNNEYKTSKQESHITFDDSDKFDNQTINNKKSKSYEDDFENFDSSDISTDDESNLFFDDHEPVPTPIKKSIKINKINREPIGEVFTDDNDLFESFENKSDSTSRQIKINKKIIKINIKRDED